MAEQMSFAEFEASLASAVRPPASLSVALQALWLEAKGDWTGAHALAQTAETSRSGLKGARDAAWVHAYLHRKEGDDENAAYWYARAGRPRASGELAAEWRTMVGELLAAANSE